MVNQKAIDKKWECLQDNGANQSLEESIPMTSITIPDLLTIIYVLVDDWY